MYDIKMMMKMGFDIKVLKELIKVYRLLNIDKEFNFKKFIKMNLSMIKGEKLLKHNGVYITSTFMPPFLTQSFFTNIRAVDDMDQVFTKQIRAERSGPISMYLCLTDKCPNNCSYCSSKHRASKGDLSTKEWIRTINQLQDMNTSIIGLTGGEPMVRKDIYDIVSAIDKRSSSMLFTSGYNLSFNKAKKLKKCGLFALGISLDSYDKEIHNKNRASDKAFDFAVKALQTSRKAGLYTVAQTVIQSENVNEEYLMKFFKFAKEKGAQEVKILEPILSGCVLTDDVSGQDMSKILYTKETRKKLIAIQHKANKMKNMPKISTFAYTESKEKFGCGAGNQHSYISACGDLYPCDFLPMNFGNVCQENIQDLWKHMNQKIGKPKTTCFAQVINRELYQAADGNLPLDLETSCKICSKNQSQVMPDYYRQLM